MIVEINCNEGLDGTRQEGLLGVTQDLGQSLPVELGSADDKIHHILLRGHLGLISHYRELREQVLILVYPLEFGYLLINLSKGFTG